MVKFTNYNCCDRKSAHDTVSSVQQHFFKRPTDSVTEMIEARPIISRPSKAESMNGCPDPFISTYNISPTLHLSYLSRGSIVTRRDFFAALFSFLSRKVFASTFNSSPPAPMTNFFQQNLSPSWPSNLNETLSEICTKAQEKFFPLQEETTRRHLALSCSSSISTANLFCRERLQRPETAVVFQAESN